VTKKSESRVVEATGTAAGGNESLSASAIQDAMAQATADAQAEGITDPDEILARKLAARKQVKEAASR
jgi:hypothetical protein